MMAITMNPEMEQSQVLMPGEGRRVAIADASIAFKATDADTNGAWSLIEYTLPPRFAGPAPHWHQHMTEGFHVLQGIVTFMIGDQSVRAKPGSFVLAVPGTLHTFANTEDVPAKVLIFMSPGGFEHYFEELSDLEREEGQWPPKNMAKLREISSRYDVHTPVRP